ncbi:PREDICTED: cytochrome b-c1 complex subunit 8-like [Trachymyrmex cornetzi]|uniref:Cytochrome b-c1 complex subunit 8 n=1 Tax=Trachymyrmex cornetzi TaxID=471704 RepID=A0A195EP30_9HYME|nr:PREDICTED: cytochrome b-c1 complex subunit 8-like [Trachymyrmex cornetzi]KYN29644.1 Cytochrome b-c1 complex subunit 8 [Trachymyrmex cornetzi]
MGLQFGNLPIRIRRVVYYSLSPLEQRAWAKSITHGIPNLLSRAMRALPPMLPGFIMSTGIYMWSTAAHDRYTRKDPKLYENDK